ncbi:hypothetical protein Tco_0873819 [Tanacetum coccineum]|uniref:Uncharacterized protein n=1 Tax=Tanacetum coccineum TaxID=301880 RepID=A0ABQ5BKP6_9ASTR
MGGDDDTITVDTIRRAAMKRQTSLAIDEVFYNKTRSKQDAVAAIECGARREAVLWVAISSVGTIAGVCALHTVHGLPLEDLQQLKKVWKLSINP